MLISEIHLENFERLIMNNNIIIYEITNFLDRSGTNMGHSGQGILTLINEFNIMKI